MPRGIPIQYSLLADTETVCAMNGREKSRHKLAKQLIGKTSCVLAMTDNARSVQ